LTVPPGACDCHVHVFGPAARFPLAPGRTYTPADASIEELLALQKRLGLERVVVVQPSPYGTDNARTLNALRELKGRARGVAVIEGKTSLEGMHEAGVRGVRVNLHTAGVDDPATAQRVLDEAAARVARLGWHLQLFANAKLLRALDLRVERLTLPLVVDHFGLCADEDDVAWLADELRTGHTYVKLSAPHRVPIDAGPLARALIAANPDRCLWGSDWPHPFSHGARNPAAVQPFDAIDDAAALQRFHGWTAGPALFRKILVDNPARLYDF
jgi:predicted TIM-barrel fold metal-dependent hydrolase